MHGLCAHLAELAALEERLTPLDIERNDIVVCPPATLLMDFARLGQGRVQIGAQTCHVSESGPHTGDLSAEMLQDAGARAVIVGHSERRSSHQETNDLVRQQAEAAHRASLMPIICVGENAEQRQSGEAMMVVLDQVRKCRPSTFGVFAIAYEPVWAIGSGQIPTFDEIAEVHAGIFDLVGEGVPILYGGSVKPSNASEIMSLPHVGGVLAGGASLKADDFYRIITS